LIPDITKLSYSDKKSAPQTLQLATLAAINPTSDFLSSIFQRHKVGYKKNTLEDYLLPRKEDAR
jgi:hypothetical protein